jgi:hypothetical protein
MRDWIDKEDQKKKKSYHSCGSLVDKEDQKKKKSYHSCGSLVELGTLGAKRKEPTGCDSVIEAHKAESFRVPNSFKVIPMGSPHSPATIHRQQLAQVHSENEQPATSILVCHPMYVAGNQRLQDRRAGQTRPIGEEIPSGMSLGARGLENPLYPDVNQELSMEEVPTAPGRTE